MSYAQAFQFTLVAEGGYSNRANDHGGVTDHGITQTTYDRYRALENKTKQNVALITDQEVNDCYFKLFWLPAHCNEMGARLGVCMFDWAVNHGPVGAIKTLQQTLGVEDDGVYGPVTRNALADQNGQDDLWQDLNNERRLWYRDDAEKNPLQGEFLTGWLHRVDRLDAYVENL